MLDLIEGNILEVKDGIICHFCNEEGIMGAGLAAQIRETFPKAYLEYVSSVRMVGTYSLVPVYKELSVCNMITQDLKGKGTQYLAVMQNLEMLQGFIKYHAGYFPTVYFPEFVGCGLGKGNPNAIQAMIEHFFPDAILVRYAP
jgi:hypothetical protein